MKRTSPPTEKSFVFASKLSAYLLSGHAIVPYVEFQKTFNRLLLAK